MDLALDLLFAVFDRTMLILGPFLVAGGSGLVCLVGYYFYTTPFVSTENRSVVTKAVLDILGLWIWFNVLFNWFMCWKTNPGRPPKEAPAGVAEGSVCQKCDSFKPPRAHHCHVCRRCVLAMDHHCPWMANCIGYYNYRYFFLTLTYLTVGCIFVNSIIISEYGMIGRLLGTAVVYRFIPSNVTFVFFLCLCVGFAVGMLFAWHVYLVLTAQTTIEFYQRRSTPTTRRRISQTWFRLPFVGHPMESNDYDLGMSENWAMVFGESSLPLKWAMPSLRKPPGDGIRWKSCRSLVSLV